MSEDDLPNNMGSDSLTDNIKVASYTNLVCVQSDSMGLSDSEGFLKRAVIDSDNDSV